MAAHPHYVLSGLFVFGFAMICAAAPARAEERIDGLTEENITAFIERTTELTGGHNSDLSPDEIVEYLDLHLDKNAHFKSTMQYNIPGYPGEKSAMSLDKDDFIESVRKGAESVTDYESSVEIKEIRISSDHTKATVQTISHESGTMPISTNGIDAEQVPVNGNSSCTQILMLEDGIIRMYNANCTTTINFLDGIE